MILKISKYRSAIMGVAILWIMLHHSGMQLSGPLFVIKRSGFGGVDIFMLLSGLGCAVSISKNDDTLSFLRRRAQRIYPHYIPILIVFLLMNSHGESVESWVRNILGNVSGISVWSQQGTVFNWYMPAIITYYAVTPYLIQFIQKYENRGTIYLILLALTALFCISPIEELKKAATCIVPYIVGMFVGEKISRGEGNNDSWKNKIFVLGAGVIGCCLLLIEYKFQVIIPRNYYNVFLPFVLITPALMVLFVLLFQQLEKLKIGRKAVSFLNWIGRISLDLYLLHIVLFRVAANPIVGKYDNTIPGKMNIINVVSWIGIFAIFIGLAWIYNWSIENLFKKLIKYKR